MRFNMLRLKGLYDIDLPIQGLSPSASYILKAADGLGPPDFDITVMNEVYLGKRELDREITLRVGLQPNYAVGERVSDLRTKLYGLLTPGLDPDVTVELRQGNSIVAKVKGQIRQMPINPFSDEPEMQIVIRCYSAFLEANSFNVPVITNQGKPSIENVGTAPAGFKFDVTILLDRNLWWFLRGTEVMYFYSDFQIGDLLRVSTIPGDRYIRKIRNGVGTNIIDSLSVDSTWLMLHGGVNVFQASGAQHNFESFWYTPRYWGI